MDGYNFNIGEWLDEDQFHPRHNIAPRSQAPVICRRQDRAGGSQSHNAESRQSAEPGSSSHAASGEQSVSESGDEVHGSKSGEDELVLQTMKWGLVPHWSKHEDKTLNTINARSEALIEGTGMWRSLRSWKRCVIPCEG